MIDVFNSLILVGSALVLASVFTSLIAFRIGAPLLLIFLGVGLLAGVDGPGGIDFDNSRAAFLIGSVALAVILFDSGFETRFASYRLAMAPALTLATLGVLLTTGILGAGTHFALDLPWPESFLVSAIVSSTDAAAVFFLLRVGGITLRDRVRSTLEIESGSNDPISIFLTLALVGFVAAGGHGDALELVESFARQIGIGGLAGVAGGFLIVQAVNRVRLDPGLLPIVVLAAALVVFGATAVLEGSGFLAVYVAGLIAGNAKLRSMQQIRRFQGGMTWLAQIVMFLTLGLLATPSQFAEVALPAVLLALMLIFVARPVAVWLCLLPFRFGRAETGFVAWVGLRGAVSILLAIVPILEGLPGGQRYFNAVFLIVLVSLLVQGWTIRPLAQRLGLIVPPRRGPVERVELDLPGDAAHELVAYTILEGSPVARGERLPRWARPSLILREGRVLNIHTARHLQAQDRVYLFAAVLQLPLLDRLFAGSRQIVEEDRDFFGDFAIAPDATLGVLAELYGLPLRLEDRDLSLAELFRREHGGEPEVGDRIALGSVDIIVRAADGHRVTEFGLALEVERKRLPLFQSGSELRTALRGVWGRVAYRAWERRQRRKAKSQSTP
jgi:cell volume regulation protein A